jgi:hypothetical protein
VTGRRPRASGAALGAALVTALTVALGALGYATLPGRVRVHWSLGAGPYVGPETLPRALGVFVVPAVAVLTLAGLWLLRGAIGLESAPRARTYYDLGMLVVVAFLFAGQVVVVIANLV